MHLLAISVDAMGRRVEAQRAYLHEVIRHLRRASAAPLTRAFFARRKRFGM
jgi:hypothetical protein